LIDRLIDDLDSGECIIALVSHTEIGVPKLQQGNNSLSPEPDGPINAGLIDGPHPAHPRPIVVSLGPQNLLSIYWLPSGFRLLQQ
jgi:hypothetical protein